MVLDDFLKYDQVSYWRNDGDIYALAKTKDDVVFKVLDPVMGDFVDVDIEDRLNVLYGSVETIHIDDIKDQVEKSISKSIQSFRGL